jgi:hypothetical protein
MRLIEKIVIYAFDCFVSIVENQLIACEFSISLIYLVTLMPIPHGLPYYSIIMSLEIRL